MLYKHKPIIFSADIIGSESILANCGDNIDGTFFSEVGITKEFKNLYSQKFGQDGHIGHAAQAFDMANLVSNLFGDLPGKVSPDEIMALLSTMKPHNGATGTLRYRDSTESGKEIQVPVAVKVIRGRKIETVTEDAGV
jgi:ABC-type branched-subunit amino acid transport system substrate-binding protein